MNHHINIESESYIGRFSAGIKSAKSSYGQDGIEYMKQWYEGAGIVEDKKTKKEYFFMFKTPESGNPFDYETKTLEEMLVNNKNPETALKFLVSKVLISEEDVPFLEID